jgi:flagellar motility protein MotE (MotC chaperone)
MDQIAYPILSFNNATVNIFLYSPWHWRAEQYPQSGVVNRKSKEENWEAEQQRKEFEELKREQAELRNLLQMFYESNKKERDWHKQEMKMLEDRMKDDEMLREKRKRD